MTVPATGKSGPGKASSHEKEALFGLFKNVIGTKISTHVRNAVISKYILAN
jgi:hypothetical protein